MFDKELIEKVCNLTCSKEDVVRNQTTIKYNANHPFKTYYSIDAIEGAIKKYLSKEWDDVTLSHWACIYGWILSGGSSENVIEDLNSLEKFIRDVVTWDLDGLSFFSDKLDEEIDLNNHILISYKNLDYIWQTRNDWKATYAMIGKYAEENDDQYVVLVNNISKKYMIIYSGHLENGFEDEYFKFVTQDEFVLLIEKLKNDGYQILKCSEEFYYEDIKED